MTCCLAKSCNHLVPLLLELSIFEDLGHKQGSMQGWVGVHGTSNGLHQHNLSAATEDQDFHPMAGPSNKKQPQAIVGASMMRMEVRYWCCRGSKRLLDLYKKLQLQL